VIFVLTFAVYTPLATTFTALFACDFVQKSTVSLQIQFSVGSKQRATTTLDFEHVFSLLSVFLIVCLHSLTLFALAFFVCATFSSVRPTFALQWLPFFVPRGTITLQTFGFCQPFLILKT
jgi:hypothetical protein